MNSRFPDIKFLRFFTFVLALVAASIHAQNFNKEYYGVNSEKNEQNHLLTILNDSVVVISFQKYHMYKIPDQLYSYQKIDSVYLLNRLEKDETFLDTTLRLDYDKKENVFVDENNSTIYFLFEDYQKLNHTTFLIDDKKLIMQNEGHSNNNSDLKNATRKLEKNIDQYNHKFYLGLKAYRKCGYDCIFGVVEFSKK